MGQKQSAPGAENEIENEKQNPDYYALLGVKSDATDEEIKKSYRKKALELHPDRNYGNIEASTALFAEIQCAYEILSDPHERAWYDSHRDYVDNGDGDGSVSAQAPYGNSMISSADIFALFSKFNPRMEFSDAPHGFYGAVRDFFEQLASEEVVAARREGQVPTIYPSFGQQDDSFEDVVRPFYHAWSNFTTARSFSWKETYRLSDAPDRRIRRLMEKENSRIREKAVRDFNGAVHSLVNLVRRRDPRYKANLETETDRQEKLRKTAAAQAARDRAANIAKHQPYEAPEWAQTGETGEESLSSSESEVEEFECVICRKTFKSEKQFEAHERSKKHIKVLNQVKKEMRAEDEELKLDELNIGDEEGEEQEQIFEIIDEEANSEHEPQLNSENLRGNTDKETTSEKSLGQDLPTKQDSAPKTTQPQGDADVEGQTVESPATDGQESSGEQVLGEINEPPRIGKAKQKRARKAKRQEDPEKSKLSCAACNENFTSRTRLFDHLRDTGHHQPPKNATKGSSKKSR